MHTIYDLFDLHCDVGLLTCSLTHRYNFYNFFAQMISQHVFLQGKHISSGSHAMKTNIFCGQEKKPTPDEADTQPILDTPSMPPPSPRTICWEASVESQWRLERVRSSSNLGQHLEATPEELCVDDQHEQDENEQPEEEVVTGDELVEPIQLDYEDLYQDNDTVQILSDDECVMSPSKPKHPITGNNPGGEVVTEGEGKVKPGEPVVIASQPTEPVETVESNPPAKPAPDSTAHRQRDLHEVEEAEVSKEVEETITSDVETTKDTKVDKTAFKAGSGGCKCLFKRVLVVT